MTAEAEAPRGLSASERDEALQQAAATRRFLERRGRRLDPAARQLALLAAEGVEAAVRAGDPEALAAATDRLDEVWRDYLAVAARKRFLRELLEVAGTTLALALTLKLLVVQHFLIPSASMAPTLQVGDHVLVWKVAYGLRAPLVNRWLVRWAEPRRGDVVVFASPRQPGHDYVKRVVGLPGDVIELRDQIVYVNGVPQPRRPMGFLTYEDKQDPASGRWLEDTCEAWREEMATGHVEPPTSGGVGDVGTAWAAAAARGVTAHTVLQCARARFGQREGPYVRVAPGHVFVLGDNRDNSIDSRSDGGWQVPVGHIQGKATLVWWSWGRDGWWPWPRAAGLRTERLFKRIE